MDPVAFTNQLIAMLQSYPAVEWLERLCVLLSTHTSAQVSFIDEAGGVTVRHPAPEDEAEGDIENLSLPLYMQDTRVGVLTLSRRGAAFDENERLIASIGLSVYTILWRHDKENAELEHRRRTGAVKAALNTLSFSELEAVVQVFHLLTGSEGLLVAGRVADQLGITRSVVVNALRKLEGTGMIETRSLGMKGTYIRVINPVLGEELRKLKG